MTSKKINKSNKVRSNIESVIDNWNIKSKHTWLDQDNIHANHRSDEYFKDISYFIDLQHLYQIIDTCYYHADMPLIPVLVQIQPKKLIEAFDGAHFLLQVWDTKSKKKVYQKPLNSMIKTWNVTFNHVIYILDQDDDYHINILRFSDQSYIKIKGGPPKKEIKHLFYHESHLIIVTQSNELQIYKIEDTSVDLNQVKIKDFYKCELNVEALLIHQHVENNQQIEQLIIVLETKENKLDFNILDLDFNTSALSDKRIFSCFKQLRDIYPREQGYVQDPIKKSVFRFHHKIFNGKKETILYAVALRQSGAFDLYSNMLHKQQVLDVKMTDVGMSLSHFFFRTGYGTHLMLKHQEQNILQFEQAEPLVDPSFSMTDINNKIMERYAKFYQAFQLVMIDDITMCLIAHQNILSVFDIINWKWINHIQFEADIVSMFFQKENQNQNQNQDNYVSCVYLANRDLFFDVTKFFESQEKVTSDKKAFQFSQQTFQHIEVTDNTNDNGDVFFVALGQDKVYVIYDCQVHDVISPFKGYNFEDGSQRNIFYLQQLQEYNLDQEFLLVALDNNNLCTMKLRKNKENSLKKGIDLCYLGYYERANLQTWGHSAVCLDNGNNIAMFDRHNAYIIEAKGKKMTTIENVECQGIVLFSQEINYGTFFQSNTQNIPGLKMIDLHQLIYNNKIKLTLLKEMDIGAYGSVYYDNEISRICFVESVKNIIVHPFLHMNTNKFIGMKDPKELICSRIVDNKLIGFKQKGELVTWDVFTGKFLKKKLVPEHNYENFEVLTTHLDSSNQECSKRRVLLMSKFEIEGCKDENFFTSHQMATTTKDQKPLIEVTPHTFRQFILLEIVRDDKIEVKLDFIFPKFNEQLMFINSFCDRMILKLQFQRVFLYKTKNFRTKGIQDKENSQWELLRQITDYPFFFDNQLTNKLEPFTKDMSLYIRYGKTAKAFMIKHTDTGEIHSIVPSDIMKLGEEDPSHIINRFKWLSNERFIVTNQYGLEKIVNITDEFKEESYNQRPLFNELNGNEWETWPYYIKRQDLQKDTLTRLKRMYQTYKTQYYLFNKRDPQQYNKYLFKVDDHNIQLFEHSFTFLNWSIMDQMNRKMIKVKDINPRFLEYMIYNILPGGNTILHKLYKSQEKIAKIFKICHKEEEEIIYHVPFLMNIHQYSPFDLSLSLKQNDYKSIFAILKYLQLYPMDHHSRAIKSVYHILIQQQIPEFLDYLDTRFQQTEELKKLDKGQIQNEFSTSSIWIQEDNIQKNMLTELQSEAKIKLELLDMPDVYHQQDVVFVKIFKQLADVKSYKFFENRAIQALIDFNFPLIRNFLIYLLIVPFCIFHIIFVVYMNVVYEFRIDDYEMANYVLSIIQIVFAIYFLINEVRQMFNLGLQYLTSVWNYIDLIAPTGVIILHGFQFSEYFGTVIDVDLTRCVISISTFFMWLKFLSALRIFKSTGYLIRMIIEVIYDMGIFLFILLITLAAFGDSFLRISAGNEEEDQFVESFVPAVLFAYSMILGGYDTEAFGEVAQPLVWIFWILCTIFDMIVMLNLLIAIISSTFERVSDNAEQAGYQEMAALISENHYLIPKSLTNKYADKNKFLIIATDMEKMDDFKDPLDSKFENLQNQINDIKMIIQVQSEKQYNNYKSLMEQQKTSETKSQEKLGEIKLMLVKNMPTELINVINHKNPLKKIMLYHLQESKDFNSYFSWGCDGRKFTGCKSGYNYYDTVVDKQSIVYHCDQCFFDYCPKCYVEYPHAHQHQLVEMTVEQLGQLNSAYESGYCCDGRAYTGCPKDDQYNEDIYEFLYHDDEYGFDFCSACVKKYKKH